MLRISNMLHSNEILERMQLHNRGRMTHSLTTLFILFVFKVHLTTLDSNFATL